MKEPVRLMDRTARSWAASRDGGCLVPLGSFFILGGVSVLLVAMGLVKARIRGPRPPAWVMVDIALLFLVPGIAMVVKGILDRRREGAAGREPWMRDHPWVRSGVRPARGRELAGRLGLAAFLTIFLIPFNWGCFGTPDRAPLFIRAVIGGFDLVVLLVWWTGVYRLLQVLRHGSGRVLFPRFPFWTGERMALRFRPPEGMDAPVTATLRCIQEREDRSGKHVRICCYALHEETLEASPDWEVPLDFEVPADAPPSALSHSPATYWELEIVMARPGLDYRERFLLPVYARASQP